MIPHTFPNESHKGHRMTPRSPVTPAMTKRLKEDGPRPFVQDRLAAAFNRAVEAAIVVYGEMSEDNPEGIDRHAMAQAAKEWACELEVKHR